MFHFGAPPCIYKCPPLFYLERIRFILQSHATSAVQLMPKLYFPCQNIEVRILKKSNEMNQSKKKKQQHNNTDDSSKDSIILKELIKELSKIEKEIIQIKVSSSSWLFLYSLNFVYIFSLGHQVKWINSSRKSLMLPEEQNRNWRRN